MFSCLCLQQPAGGAGCAGGPGPLHLAPHQPEVCLPRGRGPLAAAGEQHQQVSEGRASNLSLKVVNSIITRHAVCVTEQEVPADQAHAHDS